MDSGVFIIKFGNSERCVHPRYMRPVSTTLEDYVVDPENVDVDYEKVAQTEFEVFNPESLGSKPVEPVVEPVQNDAPSVKETAPQKSPESGETLGKYPPPANFKLIKFDLACFFSLRPLFFF